MLDTLRVSGTMRAIARQLRRTNHAQQALDANGIPQAPNATENPVRFTHITHPPTPIAWRRRNPE